MNKHLRKIAVIFGTRPEAIKLAPVIIALKNDGDFKFRVIVTAQHREMLDQVLEVFDIKPDIDLNLMEENQSLAGFAAKSLVALDDCFKREKPDMVIVQGDTTTTWVASLAAFYNKIPIAHVEAGLRTRNKYAPFPEEINRVLTTHIADLHFAPTRWAKENLIKEGIPASKIFVTGNTVIDALFIALKKVRASNYYPDILHRIPGLASEFFLSSHSKNHRPFVLITGHRRENFGSGFRNICFAIKTLANKFLDYYFIYPVHLNPNVRKQVLKILNGHKNIILIDPVDYLTFVWLMDNCSLILTDSGGIQEEAPSVGKPVLVMRNTTERPEAIEMGTTQLVGTDIKRIVREATKYLNCSMESGKQNKPNRRDKPNNPYGDGKASKRVIKGLMEYFNNVE